MKIQPNLLAAQVPQTYRQNGGRTRSDHDPQLFNRPCGEPGIANKPLCTYFHRCEETEEYCLAYRAWVKNTNGKWSGLPRVAIEGTDVKLIDYTSQTSIISMWKSNRRTRRVR